MTAATGASTATAVASGVFTVTATKPTGVAVGDWIVAFCWSNTTNFAWTAPAGWSLIGQRTDIATGAFVRIVDGTEGSSFNFVRAGSGTAPAGVQLVRVTGAAWVAPLFTQSPIGLTISLQSLTVSDPNSLLLQMVTAHTNTATTWTQPGTATMRATGNATGLAVAYGIGDEIVGTGASGTRTWTRSSSQASRGVIMAISAISYVVPTSITSTTTFGTPKINLRLSVPSITSTAVVGTPKINLHISPVSIPSTATVGTPTVRPGSVTVAPSSIAPSSTVGTPTVLPGAVTVAPSSISSTASVGTPTVRTFTRVIPASITSTTTVGTPTVIPGSVTLGVASIDPSTAFGVPTVLPGVVVIEPDGIPSGVLVGIPTVIPGSVTISPSSILSTLQIGDLTLIPGAVTIGPVGIDSTVSIGVPFVGFPIVASAEVLPSRGSAAIVQGSEPQAVMLPATTSAHIVET